MTGVQTCALPIFLDLVQEEIAKLAADKDAEKLARTALENAGLKLKKKKGEDEEGRDVEALFFISEAQIKALAQLAVTDEADKKKYKEALKAQPSVDMALFGVCG